MKNVNNIFPVILLLLFGISASGISQQITANKIAAFPLSSSFYEETGLHLPEQDYPHYFLPEDLAYDSGKNIYIAGQLKIIKISPQTRLLASVSIPDSVLPDHLKPQNRSSAADYQRYFNLRIAVDSSGNLFAALKYSESLINLFKYDKDLNIISSFQLEHPHPGYTATGFFIVDNQLIISTFPPAPAGYSEYFEEGTVFCYSVDGKFLGRKKPENLFLKELYKLGNLIDGKPAAGSNLVPSVHRHTKIDQYGIPYIYGIQSLYNQKVLNYIPVNKKDIAIEIFQLNYPLQTKGN